MKMPNLESVNQAGVGRRSIDSQVGSYGCAAARAPLLKATVRSSVFIARG